MRRERFAIVFFPPAATYPQRGSATPYARESRDGWRLTDQVLENWRKCHTGGTAIKNTGVTDQREGWFAWFVIRQRRIGGLSGCP